MSTEKDYDTDSVFAKLRESLKNLTETEPKTTLGPPTIDPITIDGIDLSALTVPDTITITNGTSFSNIYTAGTGINTTYASPWVSSNLSQDASGSLNLSGENADIKVNGHSLCDAIQRLEERLNILNVNPELEEEWAELKELGDKYRALEAKLKEQGKMWEKLKQMPPPKPLY